MLCFARWSQFNRLFVSVAMMAGLSACFAAGGSTGGSNGSSQTGLTSPTSSSGSTSGSSSSGMTSAGTSSSSSSSSSSSGTSGGETSTGGDCPGECEPGELEEGDPCGKCGINTRTCEDTCTFGEWSCEGGDACALWSLPAESQEWTALAWYDIANPGDEPSAPVEVAFGMSGVGRAMFLTNSTYHVLDVINKVWVTSGVRAEIFPEVGNAILTAAYSVNGGESIGEDPVLIEDITLLSADTVWVYKDFNPNTLTVSYLLDKPCCADNEDWMTPEAPNPGDIRAMWLDLVGDELWIDPDISGCDGLPPGTKMAKYEAAIVNDDTVRVGDIGQCFDFIYKSPYAAYPPLTLPGAPAHASLISGAFYLEGIHLVGNHD